MDDPNRQPSPYGTQIDDIPSCLIIDILSRLPIKSAVISSLVCKSWFILFSDPLFVELHRARSPCYLFRPKLTWSSEFRCIYLEPEISGENFQFRKSVSLPDSEFTCGNSCNGLLCLDNVKSGGDEIYVCNPVLGEYITIPFGDTYRSNPIRWSGLGFCSRSNQFKVLKISGSKQIAEIYTIGTGTRSWKTIGIAPSCTGFDCDPVNTFLNGSIHWVDGKEIFYFSFETEKFGLLPSPPARRDGRRFLEFTRERAGVVNGCLCVYPDGESHDVQEVWIMKEYGVEESWTKILAMHFSNKDGVPESKSLLCKDYRLIELGTRGAIYNPSFISLQDVAKGQQLTVMSRTRIGRDLGICDQGSELFPCRPHDNAVPCPDGRHKNPFLNPFVDIGCRVLRFFTSDLTRPLRLIRKN